MVDLAKPAFGQPCNGCGKCCAAEPCALARDLLNCHVAPCRAMEMDGDRMVCGLVTRPAWYMYGENVPSEQTGRLSSLFAAALGFGMGCDAEFEGEA